MTPVEAVVVGRTDLGDADRVVRLWVLGQGRVDVVARGARASRKRFPGALDPGARLRVTWTKGRGELATLGSVDLVGVPRRAREDYERLVLLGYGCEVVAVLGEHGLDAVKGFGLLVAWLELLEGEGTPGVGSRVALEAKALTFSGLTPRLVACAACGQALEGAVRFDPEAGGGVHLWCGGGRPVEAQDLAVVEHLRRLPLADTVGVGVAPAAAWLLCDFVEHHARRGLHARKLLTEGPAWKEGP